MNKVNEQKITMNAILERANVQQFNIINDGVSKGRSLASFVVASAPSVAFIALRLLRPFRCVRCVRCVGWKPRLNVRQLFSIFIFL